MRPRSRPARQAVTALAAGMGLTLSLVGCGGSGRDPRPADRGPSGAGVLAASPSPADAFRSRITVDVLPESIGARMPPGFLGLSLEYPTLEQYLGTDPGHLDPVFIALLRGLQAGRGSVIRLGGDSTDRTWWPVRGMRRPVAVDFGLTHRWTAVARALATETGDKLVLGINLAAGRRRLAALEAQRLVAGVGASRVAALEIGNEPDDYGVTAWYWKHRQRVFARPSAYSVSQYLAQFASWRSVMPRAVALAGPALARTQWMATAERSELSARRPVRLVTFHRYPLRACETNQLASDYPTIPRLLAASSSAGLAGLVAPYVSIARQARRPFRLDELNSVSCRGQLGVSNTFASALWVLDTLFNARAVGVDGVNLHMLPGSAYQAFAVRHSGRRWSATVSPIYYGMLMFARAFPPGARLLGVSAPAGPVKVWADRSAGGRLRVVLINEDPSSPVTARVQLPGPPTPARSQALIAPSISATGDVRLGGQTFGASTRTGRLKTGRHLAQVPATSGYYDVPVPAGSAVLLTR